MRVRTRLLLLGVLVPALVFGAALVASRWLFRREMLASVDRELRARAAVESVGAFDHPEEHPHLHLGRANFPSDFVELDPRGAFFSAEGVLLASDPADESTVARGPHSARDVLQKPSYWTSPDGTRREMAVGVRAPSGHLYLLRLSCSLGPLEQTVSSYVRTTTVLLGFVLVALVMLWLWLARYLSERLENIASNLPSGRNSLTWNAPEIIRDEIDALEKALAVSFEKLRQARNAEEQFLARAAHELRTPLGIMLAELDMALRRDRDPMQLRAALATTRNEVARLSDLSTQLLDLTAAQRVSEATTETDAGEIVDEALRAASALLAERNLRVERNVMVGAAVRLEPAELRQAIDNLLVNAANYAPARSVLRVSVVREGTLIVLRFEDQGPGVPADQLAKVFDSFFRASNASGFGTGLGLAITKAIVERAGGSVHAENAQPNGAVFTLRIPAVHAP